MRNRNQSRYRAALAASLFATTIALKAGVARAQGVAEDDLETVMVIGRIARPLAATEASVTLIDATRIEQLQAQDLRDLIRLEPGVSVRGDAARFGDESITIRGIGGNRVRIETDGVPRPSAFAIGSFANAGRSLADLDFVRKIEILKGPASATYGSAAIGGIVSVSTLNPIDMLADERRFALRSRWRFSSDDHSGHGSALAAGRMAGAEWLVGVLHRESQELQNEWIELDANPQRRRTDHWLAKLVFGEMSNPLGITASGADRRSRTQVESVVLQPGRFANTIGMLGDDRGREFSLALDQTLLDVGPFRQVEWSAHSQRTSVQQLTFETRRAVAPRTPALQLDRQFRYEAREFGTRVTAAIDHDWGPFTHRWAWGADYSQQDIDERRNGLQTTLPSGPTSTTILGEVFPLRDFPLSRVIEAGMFAFDEIQREGSRWTWSPALRIDHHRLTPTLDAIYLADNPTQTPVAVRNTSVSPRIGVSYRWADELSIFGQYTHGFRSPPFEDVNIGLDLPQFRTRAIPNPGLRPEKSDHFEVGLRSAHSRISGSASVFLARYRDFIESKVSLGIDPASGYLIFQSQNRARARIWGAEMSLRAPLGSNTGEASRWNATLAAARTRGDDTATGRPLNSIDPARASLGLEYAHPEQRWRIEAALTLVAAQRRIDESAGPLARSGGFATVDVLGGWKLRDDVHVQAAVFNLLDRRYVEWSDIRGRAANDPSLDLYTRPGRSVTVSVTLQLD